MYDYSKLKGRIREKLNTDAKFGEAIGLCKSSVSMKLNNQVSFSQEEISKIQIILDIPDEELCSYFFKKNVQELNK